MSTPRSWWERAGKTGKFHSLVPLLSDLRKELLKDPEITEQPSASLLVALAFIDDDEPRQPERRFDDSPSNYTPEEYFSKAKKVLAKRPELTEVGNLLEKAMEQQDFRAH